MLDKINESIELTRSQHAYFQQALDDCKAQMK